MIIFAFRLVPSAAPAAAAAAADTLNGLFRAVEGGLIFQGPLPAFVTDCAPKLPLTNKEIKKERKKSEALIDLNFYNFLR